MKKTVLILALIAIAVIPVWSFDLKAAGIQLGTECGVAGEFEITDKIDGYATVAWSFSGRQLHGTIGGLYEVSKFDLNLKNPLVFDAAVEVGIGISNTFIKIAPKLVASFSYDFKVQELPLTAFARFGVGPDVIVGAGVTFGGSANIGILYNL